MKFGELFRRKGRKTAKWIHPNKHKVFDAARYLRNYPDVASSGMDALEHYVLYGKSEGREYFKKDVVGRRFGAHVAKVLDSGLFDERWYRDQYEEAYDIGGSAALHFLEEGVWEGLDPGPSFSTLWYWEQYPDIQGANPLLHFIDHGRFEGRHSGPPSGVLDAVRSILKSVADLDPQLYATEQLDRPASLSIANAAVHDIELKTLLREILKQIPKEATHFVFVPWCIHSGADVVASSIVRSAVGKFGLGSVVVFVLDFDRLDGKDWLPDNIRIVNVARLTAETSHEKKIKLVELIIRTARPKKIININSNIMWRICADRGKFIGKYTDIYSCVFCSDYNKGGLAVGYADLYIRDTIHIYKKVYLDNRAFKAELIEKHHFANDDARRMIPLKIPIRVEPSDAYRRTGRRDSELHIFWASRIARQKNYALLAEIIRKCPESYRFSIWGTGNEEDVCELRKMVTGFENVELCGAYSSFDALPLERYDAFLYTSLCDGIPNVVLEAAAFAFPVVASNVGGVGEVVSSTRGWLIDAYENADAYVAALNEVASDTIGAARKGKRLAEYVCNAHTWASLETALSKKGGFLEIET
ncbi:MAG: glycosyltransferase family 4 protein [Rhodobiaceae bacterium]|nr:glycosyltransferase family 4 protein [Rhodobiaceae bacterium]MCC0055205.1 glycosyltransferase family 4 protein [Rhodobiaceae bacterium]